jgi:hypothetical protein
MGKCAILRHFETDSGTLSGGAWQSGLPLANIRDDDLKKVARSATAAEADTQFRIDFGTTITRYLSVLILLGHSISTAGEVEFVLTDSATDASPTRWTSGDLPAWRPVVVFGADPWGGFSWDGGAYPEGYVSPPEVIHKLSTVRKVGLGGWRYLFCYIKDSANAAGFVDVGRFLGGPVWQPDINISYGFAVHPVDPSATRRTRGALRLVESLPGWREFRLRFGRLNDSEAWGFVYQWMKLGKKKPVWFAADWAQGDEIGSRRSAFCALKDTAPLTHDFHENEAWELVLEELT